VRFTVNGNVVVPWVQNMSVFAVVVPVFIGAEDMVTVAEDTPEHPPAVVPVT
jgi:hypothetical protein